MSALAAGCAGTNRGNNCDGWAPIVLSKGAYDAMSDNDKRQVTAHNEYGEQHCGWKAPQ